MQKFYTKAHTWNVNDNWILTRGNKCICILKVRQNYQSASSTYVAKNAVLNIFKNHLTSLSQHLFSQILTQLFLPAQALIWRCLSYGENVKPWMKKIQSSSIQVLRSWNAITFIHSLYSTQQLFLFKHVGAPTLSDKLFLVHIYKGRGLACDRCYSNVDKQINTILIYCHLIFQV